MVNNGANRYVLDFNITQNTLQDIGLVKSINNPAKKALKKEFENDFVYRDLEEKLKQTVGTKVKINRKSENAGKIEIDYYSQHELEKIIAYFK